MIVFCHHLDAANPRMRETFAANISTSFTRLPSVYA